jgi:tetratricopeptide (TPR) repeat protein
MSRRYGIALLSVWPGLAQIWTGQELLGLLLAAFFAGTLNLAILTQTVWTELLTPVLASFLAALAALTWILALVYTVWWLWRCHPDRYQEQIESLFREAQEFYLQGRWNEARRRLEQVLARDDGDADALMQLGSLFVRTDQPALARRAFRQCLEQEGGAKWRWEIDHALRRLDSAD